jgi:predicted O-methyltransferase YrrM
MELEMSPTAMYSEKLDSYLDKILPPRPPVVLEMEKLANEKKFPIIGPHVGRLLTVFAKTINAARIFEMGSGYGYSAFWFGLGLAQGGKITLTDGSEDNRKLAAKYLSLLEMEDTIEFKVGDAMKLLENEKGTFDIIYNDVNKEQYPEAYRAAVDKLRPGGLFITDNVLWDGKVAEDNPDEATAGVLEFNRLLFGDRHFFSSIIPIRDGLLVAVKQEIQPPASKS